MKTLFAFLALLAVLQFAKADTLAQWTFETSRPAGFESGGNWFPNITAEVGLGTASALHSMPTFYSAIPGNGSMYGFGASNTWSRGDFYQFAVSSAGYQNITISYDQTGTAPGPSSFYLEYSIDGNIFTKFGNDYTVNFGGWNTTTRNAADLLSFDLSSIVSINDQSALYFRIVDDTTGTFIATDRIDNVLISGQPVPEPSSRAVICVAILSLVGFRKRMNNF